MLLFPADFGTLTALLRDATDHPLALVLEGGMDLHTAMHQPDFFFSPWITGSIM